MKSQLLSANHIWQRPTDLLLFLWQPDSSLQREIDWYLNFSISKAYKHKAIDLDQSHHQLLNDVGLEEIHHESAHRQVICLAPEHFFAKYVVALNPEPKISLAERFFQTMNWLKASRGSILLPTSITVEQFETSLQKLGFDKEVFLAVDVSAPTE